MRYTLGNIKDQFILFVPYVLFAYFFAPIAIGQ